MWRCCSSVLMRQGADRGFERRRRADHANLHAAPGAHLAGELAAKDMFGPRHEFGEQNRKHHLRAPLSPVIDLDGNANPERPQRGAMDSFGATLGEGGLRELTHDDGVEAPLSCYEVGCSESRIPEPPPRL